MAPPMPPHATRKLSTGEAGKVAETAFTVLRGPEETYRAVKAQDELRESLLYAWPGWQQLAEDIYDRLGASPHAVVLRGLPLENPPLSLIALTSALGDIVEPYQQSWSRLVRRIEPATDRAVGPYGMLNEKLHTDGTDWRAPNDLTLLLCVRPDAQGGGRSRLMPLEPLLEEPGFATGPVSTLLSEPVPWAIAEALGGGVYWAPVASPSGIRWLRYTIDEAVRRGVELSNDLWASLIAFEEALEHSDHVIETALQEGELLVIDNRRCMHARTGVSAPTSSERLLLRTKATQRAPIGTKQS